MNKKITAVGVVLCLSLACGLAACGLSGYGEADGNYPYDIAAEQGFTGSEGSWLAQETDHSVYYTMWQEAVGEGYGGSYIDFLQALDLSEGSIQLQRCLLSTVNIVTSVSTSASASAGAGVILSVDNVSGDMEILTNYHVVYSSSARRICDEISLYLYGGENPSGEISATYYGGSASEDIAILHVDGSDTVLESAESGARKSHTNVSVVAASAAQAAEIGSSESLVVGDRVYAVGNPEAMGISAVEGILSVDAEYVPMSALDDSGDSVNMLEMRIDAPVNHGNSGGGLFNAAGELVGIVNARSEDDGVVGIGYAIPIDHAIAVVQNIIANGGTYRKALLGITIQTESSRSVYDEETGRAFISEKLVIISVDGGTAAYRAGLNIGDTIVSMTLNGKTVQATRQYKMSETLLGVRKGDTLTVVVSRKGEAVTVNVTFDRDAYFVS